MSGPQRLLMAGGSSAPITVTDSFDRADSTTSMGNADTGQAWVPRAGSSAVWGIISNEAYQPTNGTGTNKYEHASIDVGASNIDMSVDITAAQAGNSVSGGIMFRYTGITDYWDFIFNRSGAGALGWFLQYRTAGGFTTIASGTPGAITGTLRIVDNGVNSITAYINGASVATSSNTTHAGGTRQGIMCRYSSSGGANSGTGWRHNNYSMVGT